MKILFTCVGRRVELIQAFRKAAEIHSIELFIYGSDNCEYAPALQFCDKIFLTCKISDENYIPSLIEYCSMEKIDLVIPTIDTDLLLLSKNKKTFLDVGTNVLVSEENTITKCRDKFLTSLFFKSIKLHTPELTKTIDEYKNGFPAFIRPLNGSSSIDAYKVSSFEDLKSRALNISNPIIAKYICGTEYTVDVFCDFNGSPIYITPRIRLATRSGEVSRTMIDLDGSIINEVKYVLSNITIVGPAAIQLIKNDEDNKNYYIEINPRFGGGSPISMLAGANSAEALLLLLQGEKVTYQENAAEDKAVYSRFDQTIRVGKE